MRILIFLTVASLVPTFWLAGFLYQRMAVMIRRAEEETAIHYLEQFSHTTSLIMKNMEDTVHLLRLNNDFLSYQQLRDKNYFRSFQEHYNLERISEYSKFLKLRAGINRNLGQFAATEEFIQSVYFYDPQVREVFSMEFIPMPIQAFPHREWYNELSRLEDSTIIGPVLNRDRQKVLYSVFPRQNGSEMVFIININLALFYDFLWKQIEPRNTESFFILDDSGNPLIYDTQDEKRIHSLAWSIDRTETGLHEVTIDKDTLLVSSWSDGFTHWTYHAINDKSQFTAIFNRNRRYVTAVLLPLLLVNLTLLLILRRLLYQPITRVMNHLSEEKVDSLDGLEQWIDETVHERESREELLDRTVPAYQISFLSRKLDGGEPDLHSRPVKLPFPEGELRVLAFFTEEEGDMAAGLRGLNEWEEARERGSVAFRKGDNLFLITGGEKQSYDEVCRNTDSFLIRFLEESSIRLFGAVGRDTWSLSALDKGKHQVERALKDYLKLPFGTPVIELGRPGGTGLSPMVLEEEFTDRILSRMRRGDVEGAREEMKMKLDSLDRDSMDREVREVQHFHINLINSLIMRLRDQGYDIYFSEGDGESPFVTLLSLRTGESVRKWIFSLLEEITARINDKRDGAASRSYIRRAEELIEKQLGDNVSLSGIADQMHISPFYLSRLFREVRNESFTDYLRVERMKMARMLLEDPSVKIKDISRRVGYWSSNYFIKVFRKHYGVTPGEFRETLLSRRENEGAAPEGGSS